jgi:hypothetical protein
MEEATSGEIRNVFHGSGSGSVLQAGVVHGGVHFHHSRPPDGKAPVPRQLPAASRAFVGRAVELSTLDRVCRDRIDRRGLALITGPAGVGKSALALRWAERMRARFPHGQLYADLGAFDPAGPVAPEVVLGRFLRSLGTAVERVPHDVAEQAALFRSTTADRQILVVLDNAVSAAQVRQLLPGGADGMVVVTARWRLSGLIGDGATVVDLEPLGEQESIELLAGGIGATRVSAEASSCRLLARLCAGLPIALAVTAAHVAAHPRRSIVRLVAELSDEQQRLDGLSIPEDLSVRATFDLSYRSLPDPVARCYRAVGLHFGAQVSVPVVAAALATPRERAATMLDALVEINLLGDVSDGRYQMHDLIRLHARRLSEQDPEHDVLAGRITEWYLAGVHACDVLLTPYRRRPSEAFRYLDVAGPELDRDGLAGGGAGEPRRHGRRRRRHDAGIGVAHRRRHVAVVPLPPSPRGQDDR